MFNSQKHFLRNLFQQKFYRLSKFWASKKLCITRVLSRDLFVCLLVCSFVWQIECLDESHADIAFKEVSWHWSKCIVHATHSSQWLHGGWVATEPAISTETVYPLEMVFMVLDVPGVQCLAYAIDIHFPLCSSQHDGSVKFCYNCQHI